MASDMYQRYKTGTAYLLQWLADTARAHNLTPDIFRHARRRGGRRRMKLTTRQILRLAHAIATNATASSRRPADIQSVITVLLSVLQDRRECAAFYRGTGNKDDCLSESDCGHQKFIDVLTSVLHCLRMADKADATESKTELQSAAASLPNLFDALKTEGDDEDPSAEDDDVTEDTTVADEGADQDSKIIVELEDESEAKSLALYCLFKDCTTIRRYVRTTWEEYLIGKIALEHASILTEAAIVLLRKEAAIIEFDHSELENFDNVANLLQKKATVSPGSTYSYHDIFKPAHEFDAASTDDSLCQSAYLTLQLLRHAKSHGRSMLASNSGMHAPSYLNAAHPFARILHQATPHFRAMLEQWTEDPDHVGCADWFSLLYSSFLRDDKSRISLLLACITQIQQDIFDVLGCSHLHLETGPSTIFSTFIENHSRLVDDINITSYTQKYRSVLSTHVEAMTGRDLDLESSKGLNPALRSLLKAFPVLAGCYARRWTELIYLDGVVLCNMSNIVQCMAYLTKPGYNHLWFDRRFVWSDLFFLLDVYGETTIGPKRMELSDRTPGLRSPRTSVLPWVYRSDNSHV